MHEKEMKKPIEERILLYCVAGILVMSLVSNVFLYLLYSGQDEEVLRLEGKLEQFGENLNVLNEKLEDVREGVADITVSPGSSLPSPAPFSTQPPTTSPTRQTKQPCVLGEHEGLPVVSWSCADKYYEREVVVEGVIVATKNTGSVCFLNFDRDYKTTFTAVIFAKDFSQFPQKPEEYYLNKKVRVRGTVKEYNGKPEIILKKSSQIWFV